VDQRRPRLDDVAALVGVSPASVSLVLRNAPGPSADTRRRVLAAAAELGYRPDRTASLLARRRRRMLGVLFDVHNAFHAELVEEIHTAAAAVGYEVVLATVTRDRDEDRAVDALLDFRCEALLLLGPDASSARLAGLAARLPVVALGRRDPVADVVRSADDTGVALALDHLIALGHRDIVYVDGGRGAIAAARRRGYRAAVRRAGLPARVVPGDPTEQGGITAGRDLARAADRPSAVVAFNDRVALGLLDSFARASLAVPKTISVAGYDDSSLARLVHADLTTVNQDPAGQARSAVAAAVERLDQGRTTRREVVLAPRLVIRGSTGPPGR
jgi:DNA-binding LacI/PurR family transcriptional regulator